MGIGLAPALAHPPTHDTYPSIPKAGATIAHAGQSWEVVQILPLTMQEGRFQVMLLMSHDATGESGVGEPLHAADLVILKAGAIVYDHLAVGGEPRDAGFLLDDQLLVTDVTGDGRPEAIFHSGSRGVSDQLNVEHIISWDPRTKRFTDIASADFTDSFGFRGFMWLRVGSRIVPVTAEHDWDPASQPEERCHYCGSPFVYRAYRWNSAKSAFEAYKQIRGQKSWDQAGAALKGDAALLEASLR
jgi:hypothetical protein